MNPKSTLFQRWILSINQHWQIDVESTWISRWPTSRCYFNIYQRWINVQCLLGKDQEEILTCALQNGCSKIGKILGKSPCRSPASKTLERYLNMTSPLTFSNETSDFFWANNFTKTPLNDLLERVFICLVSQIIIGSAGQLSKCNRKNTVIAFRILVNSHKLISKFTGKNLWWNSLLVNLQSPTSMQENSITSVFLLNLLNFSEQLL